MDEPVDTQRSGFCNRVHCESGNRPGRDQIIADLDLLPERQGKAEEYLS